MATCQRVFGAAVAGLLVALAFLVVVGVASADVGPFDPGPFTDNRADLPARPGTIVEVDYGDFTIPANSEVHNAIDLMAPPPCTNCRITDIVPDLVYAPGSPDGSDSVEAPVRWIKR